MRIKEPRGYEMAKTYNVYSTNSNDDLELVHCPKLRHENFIKSNNSALARRESELAELYEKYGRDESKMDKSVAKKIANYERIIKDLKEAVARTEMYMSLPNKYGR